jgi:hypothetical protein
MADFSGQYICNSYTNILNIGTGPGNCTLPASCKCIVTDSSGVNSSLSIGRSGNGISVTGPIDGSNNLNICGIACVTGCLGAGDSYIANAGSYIASHADISGNLSVNGTLEVGTGGTGLYVTDACTKTCKSTEIGGTLTVCGNTAVDGCITATQDVIAYYSSDKRLKNNLNTICNTQSIVNSLTGYSFDWNEESGREGHDLGVIAQDVQEVLPDIVHERDNGYLAVDYIKLIPVLIEEVKRLNNEVEKLKKD